MDLLKEWSNWPEELHSNYEQVKRIESGRKLKKNIVEIDKKNGYIRIQGSDFEPYETTLTECDCFDFERREMPCKHIYCLALTLKILKVPKYTKKESSFSKEDEIDRYKQLYLDGQISADTYTGVCSVISKIK